MVCFDLLMSIFVDGMVQVKPVFGYGLKTPIFIYLHEIVHLMYNVMTLVDRQHREALSMLSIF